MLNTRQQGPAADQMNYELVEIIKQIYQYVFYAQLEYCKMDQSHPFLEQTYLNIAIFKRECKNYLESLSLWQ